jgi:hypothetical protein
MNDTQVIHLIKETRWLYFAYTHERRRNLKLNYENRIRQNYERLLPYIISNKVDKEGTVCLPKLILL